MDISFDIHNEKGDHVRVALSYYDSESIKVFTTDPYVLSLMIYDVSLLRLSGANCVGFSVLSKVSDILGRFIEENDDAVLCFYCDDLTDIERNHNSITPQEYRSKLFSVMFDKYVRNRNITGIINKSMRFETEGQPKFVHFICRNEHCKAIEALAEVLVNK